MENSDSTTLNALKHQRVLYLKQMKRLANKLLTENKTASGWKAKWEKDVIQNNILQLKKIIQKLNADLRPVDVEQYAKIKSAMLAAFPDPQTIEHYMSISLQKIKEEDLSLNCPGFQ